VSHPLSLGSGSGIGFIPIELVVLNFLDDEKEFILSEVRVFVYRVSIEADNGSGEEVSFPVPEVFGFLFGDDTGNGFDILSESGIDEYLAEP